MTRLAVCVALLLAACASPRGEGPGFDAARRAFADLRTAEAQTFVPAERDRRDPARVQAAFEESDARIDAARERFLAAFAATDWADWPHGEDDRLVARALPATGRRALERGDAASAIRAYELTAERLFAANTSVSADLPYAMFVAGDADGAIARAEDFARRMKPERASPVEDLLGDFACVRGDLDTARRWYARAAAHDPGC
jgi:hypothetical protein